MKRWTTLVLAGVWLGTLLAWAWHHLPPLRSAPVREFRFSLKSNQNARTPRIKLDSAKHDFGTMDQYATGKHLFEICNNGPGDLVLRFAWKSCACSELRLNDMKWDSSERWPTDEYVTLAPRAKTYLEIKWNTQSRTGDLTVVAKLETNDPEKPFVDFWVNGHVVPQVELSTSQISLGVIRSHHSIVRGLEIYSRKRNDLEITRVESSNPLIRADVEVASMEFLQSKKALSGFKVTMRIDSELPVGPFIAQLILHTNCEERPEVTVYVHGLVEGEIQLSPWRELNFGTVKRGSEKAIQIFVRRGGKNPRAVKLGGVSPHFLDVALIPISEDTPLQKLIARIHDNVRPGEYKGFVELLTEDGSAVLFEIPVLFVVRE